MEVLRYCSSFDLLCFILGKTMVLYPFEKVNNRRHHIATAANKDKPLQAYLGIKTCICLHKFYVKIDSYLTNYRSPNAFTRRIYSENRGEIPGEIKIPQELRSCRYYYTLLKRPCSQCVCKIEQGAKSREQTSPNLSAISGTACLLIHFFLFNSICLCSAITLR